jgi:AAA domain/REase_MTES_1575
VLEALADAEPHAEDAVRLDDRMKALPAWARKFLRDWRPTTPGHPPGEDALGALDRAWLGLALAGRTAASIETAIVDDDLLANLSADVESCLDAAGRGVLARFRHRVLETVADRARGAGLRKLGMDVAKKRNRATMRQLVERYWDQGLSTVRPVWFCSPESVASLFPLRADLFDLVVLDEASQCPVEAALPTLARARRALVAGDDQQMPPTNFFRSSGFDPDEDEQDDELAILAATSVLGVGRVAFPGTVLRWHYRSRHEELVAFSNAAFYGGRLITAPRAARPSPLEGLRWVRVPGLWRDNTNDVEAARVVEIVGEVLAAEPAPSVGVIAFNKEQAELVRRLLDERMARDTSFRAAMERDRTRPVVEQLFVRNLENVQGDERDVIVLSVGYGPTAAGGRVRASFGPVANEGGEKRLNVAITRARVGLAVVTSIEPDELDTASTKNVGPKLLKAYLEFVRAHASGRTTEAARLLDVASALGGAKGVTAARATGHDGSRRRVGERVAEELASTLEREGLRVERAFGLGHRRLDLVVGRPGETSWALGVDCTGFLREPDAMSRDVYGPSFWRRLGWRVMRVTPSMWRSDRARLLSRLIELVTRSA